MKFNSKEYRYVFNKPFFVKRFFLFSVLLKSLLTGLPDSFAGTKDGGGGKGVVCRGDQAQVQTVETLDLFEGRELYPLPTREFNKPLGEVLDILKTEMMSTMDQPDLHLFPIVDQVQRIMKFTGPSVIITPVDDAAAVAVPANCQIEQLASYIDDDLLLVNKSLWDHLSTENKAALILHEAIYRLERHDGAVNSLRSRKIVAHVLAGFSFVPVRQSLPTSAKFCVSTDGAYAFSYFPTSGVSPKGPKGMTKLQFTRFDGRWVFSKKTVTLSIFIPWGNEVAYLGCSDWADGCDVTGGTTASNFEGGDFVSIGAVQIESPTSSEFHYYISAGSNHVEHTLNCQP